jgi:glycolate oxidase FAD binding subunit
MQALIQIDPRLDGTTTMHPAPSPSTEPSDAISALQERVARAHAQGDPLRVVGGGSKDFYGREVTGEPLFTAGLQGITSYEPSELVITAMAGTALREIEAALAEQGQMLAFEPPHYGASATLGGTIACGFSGPRRPYAGSARDFVLGVRCLNGKGELLRFGGQVMKNVAGYDLSRLMVGSLGTLGVLVDVSLKVLPLPEADLTLAHELTAAEAIECMNRWAGQPLPLSAAAYDTGCLTLRLSGAAAALDAARAGIGGDVVADAEEYWSALREHRSAFFESEECLWRLSLPPATPHLHFPGEWLLEWGGAQRWLKTAAAAEEVRAAARVAGGHATIFRHGDRTQEVFAPLPAPLLRIHRELKAQFDPMRILNPGRMYAGL